MKLTLVDGKYRLETDSGQAITLTVREALQLGLLIQRLKDQIEPPQSGGAIQPVAMIRISDVIVGLTMHHDQIVVRFQNDGADQGTYVFSPENAQIMREGLDQKIREIEIERGRKTKQ
jgi:hypothetical protein